MGRGKRTNKKRHKHQPKNNPKSHSENKIQKEIKTTDESKKAEQTCNSESQITTEANKINHKVVQVPKEVKKKTTGRELKERIEKFVNNKGTLFHILVPLVSVFIGFTGVYLILRRFIDNVACLITFGSFISILFLINYISGIYYIDKGKDKIVSISYFTAIFFLAYFYGGVDLASYSDIFQSIWAVVLLVMLFCIFYFLFKKVMVLSWLQFISGFIFIFIIGWLKAEDIAFFIGIILSVSMSAQIYENIYSFLKKSKFENKYLYQILEPPRILNNENNKYINKYSEKEWNGKIQYIRITLSILLFLFYIVFKYTEQIPLSLEYFIINHLITDSPDNLNFLSLGVLYILKSFDRMFGFLGVCCALLCFKKAREHLSIGVKMLNFSKEQIVIGLIFFLLFFILPIGLNSYSNNLFKEAVEESLKAEGIKEEDYSLTFYNRHDFRSKDKSIEVKFMNNGPYLYTYKYINSPEELYLRITERDNKPINPYLFGEMSPDEFIRSTEASLKQYNIYEKDDFVEGSDNFRLK